MARFRVTLDLDIDNPEWLADRVFGEVKEAIEDWYPLDNAELRGGNARELKEGEPGAGEDPPSLVELERNTRQGIQSKREVVETVGALPPEPVLPSWPDLELRRVWEMAAYAAVSTSVYNAMECGEVADALVEEWKKRWVK